MPQPTHQQIIDYFRSNIFEALGAYNGWKTLYLSKSSSVVGEKLAARYREIQNYHTSFFAHAERALLIHFVLTCLHPFENRSDSYSLRKINQAAIQTFERDNESVLDALHAVRNKLFAHRDNDADSREFQIPSSKNMDAFFESVGSLYNGLAREVDGSVTDFSGALAIKESIEQLMMNLWRGEAIRKLEIEAKWGWQQDNNRASAVL